MLKLFTALATFTIPSSLNNTNSPFPIAVSNSSGSITFENFPSSKAMADIFNEIPAKNPSKYGTA